jgi:hypothetical protein
VASGRSLVNKRLVGTRELRLRAGRGGPYWPGAAVELDADGVPRPRAACWTTFPRAPERGRPSLLGGTGPGEKARGVAVTPSPTRRSAPVGEWWCVDQQWAPGCSTATAAVADPQLAATLEHGPHRAGLVRAAVGAGPVLGGHEPPGRPGRPRGRSGGPAGSRSTPTAPGWRAPSPRRRPRRSGSGPGAAVCVPEGSGPASPRCDRRPTPRGSCRCRPGARRPAARRRHARQPSFARRLEAGQCSPMTRSPSGGVALVPGADVGQRPDRAGAAEVPELDEHRAPALLVHAQRRHVDPGEARGKEGAGMVSTGGPHRARAKVAPDARQLRTLWPMALTTAGTVADSPQARGSGSSWADRRARGGVS